MLGLVAGAALAGTSLFLGASARARLHRARRAAGSEDQPLPPPPGVEYDLREPCFIDPDPGRRKLPEGSAVWADGADASCANPAEVEPASTLGVPAAVGSPTPMWPVAVKKPRWWVSYRDVRGKYHGAWGNVFGAERISNKTGERRFHIGIDLDAKKGDLVRAMEPGTIVAIQTFTKGTWAILEETDSGIVILYGELADGSWRKYVKVGDRVETAQPIAKVGLMGTKDMLHLETYAPGTRQNVSWFEDEPKKKKPWYRWGPEPPAELLDPTRFLILASILERNRAQA